MTSYYVIDSNAVHFRPGAYYTFNSKTIPSGNGNVEIFRFTPGIFNDIPCCHFLNIVAFSYTNSGTNEIKHFRSKVYLVRELTGSTIRRNVDECVDRDTFTEQVNASDPYEYILYAAQDPNFERQITVVVDCILAPNTDGLSSITFN